MENSLAKRKDIRLKNFDYGSPGAYFVTICTEKRKNYFWNGKIDPQKFIWKPVGANCVRPLNLPLSDIGKIVFEEHKYGRPQVAPTVSRMVKQFKGAVTKKAGKSIWQKSFVEHVIRNKQDYETKTTYIVENPVRWFYDELYTQE